MGLGGISIWQLLIILAIVIMLFGTKRLRSLGSDLGSAVKGFRKSMQEDDGSADKADGEKADGDAEGDGSDEGEASTQARSEADK